MRNPSLVSVVVGVAIAAAGCKKPDAAPQPAPTAAAPAPKGAAAVIATAGRAPRGKPVDKTAGQDGPLTADSAPDGVIALSVDGPLTALAVVTVDGTGAPDGQFHWDTIVEGHGIPAAWKIGATGADTWQLGVEENGIMLNAKDGSLTPLGAGRHSLLLYYGDATHAVGSKLMVLAERPDHTTIKSNVFTM